MNTEYHTTLETLIGNVITHDQKRALDLQVCCHSRHDRFFLYHAGHQVWMVCAQCQEELKHTTLAHMALKGTLHFSETKS